MRKLGQREKKNGENGKVLEVASVSKMHAVRSCTFSRFGLIFDSELPRSQCKKDKTTGCIICKGYKGNRQLCELYQGKHGWSCFPCQYSREVAPKVYHVDGKDRVSGPNSPGSLTAGFLGLSLFSALTIVMCVDNSLAISGQYQKFHLIPHITEETEAQRGYVLV